MAGAATFAGMDPATAALVDFAAAAAGGDAQALAVAAAAAVRAEVPAAWVEELLLQSVLMVGWPRALLAAGAWRRLVPRAEAAGDPDADYARHPEWSRRGEAVCRTVYGPNYARLRENVRALHPALEAWMVTEGYGRTLGRPGLDLARRELCVVAQVAVQGAERQLHSHLRGALNAGASPAAIDAALALALARAGAGERTLATALWGRIRP